MSTVPFHKAAVLLSCSNPYESYSHSTHNLAYKYHCFLDDIVVYVPSFVLVFYRQYPGTAFAVCDANSCMRDLFDNHIQTVSAFLSIQLYMHLYTDSHRQHLPSIR